MKGRQYQYQGFLLQCPYRNVELEKYRRELPANTQMFFYSKNLLDYPEYRRQIPLTYLDLNIDTVNDLEKITCLLKDVQALYIVDDQIESENTFVKKHSEATKQAFIWQLENRGILCYLTK